MEIARKNATKARVLIVDCDHETIAPEEKVLGNVQENLPWLACKTEEEIIEHCQNAEILLIQYAPMSQRVLEHLPNCQAIIRYGVGVDSIDLQAASARKIVVSNVPDYGTEEVADQALAFLMCLTRKVLHANALVKKGVWNFQASMPVFRLRDKTLGIIGCGRIGQALAKRAEALGMKIVAFDPHVKSPLKNIEMQSLDDVLRVSDVVSIHCPLATETKNLLNTQKLALMKSSAFLVNTARGGIVDEVALEKALNEKKLAGAAMDVLLCEPASLTHPLLAFDNFICTPHMAWHSTESALELKRKVAEEALRILQGQSPLYQLNKGF